ncbi:hypothetical protein pipiens_008339 [Culex pipiens pipiens]|uniref:Zinc finger protein n=2 Tax=Culex pipiens TaxID=7175 RepID=A0ABD1DJ33_CULPP
MDPKSSVSALCRVCMKTTKESKSDNIYRSSSDPDQPNLYEMLGAICPPAFPGANERHETKVSSGLPSIVCLICKSGVVAAYEIHRKCIETDRKLREMVVVKQEVLDEAEEGDEVEQETVVVHADPLVHMEEDRDDKDGILSDVDMHGADSDESYHEKPRRGRRKKTVTVPAKPSSGKIKNKRTCELCSVVFKTIKEMKGHMRADHAGDVFGCEVCDDVFVDETKFEEHKISHTSERPHECSYCKEKFRSLTDLKYHTMNHTNDHPFRCSVCGKGFPKKHALQYHMLRHTGEKPFVCQQCPSKFYSKGELKMHMVTHTLEKNHVCDVCGNRFTKNTSLMKHVRRVHAGLRPFPCSLCTLKFDNAHHLKRHMRTHTGEKPYKCAYCDRAYAQSNDLVKHSKIHVGQNPYACDRCDAAFRLMTELRNHYKVHFQPGDQSEANATSALVKKHESKAGKEQVEFTSMATLNRRFEQEMQRKESEQQQQLQQLQQQQQLQPADAPVNFGLNFSSRF